MTPLADDLRDALGADVVVRAPAAADLSDATEARGLRGRADAVAEPRSAGEVAAVVRWCYAHDVPIVPRGGGTGFAGGAVPTSGGVVVSLARMTAVRAFDPLLWRIHAEAGVRTADLRRIARESGLLFPPDPGAAESVADRRQHRDERGRPARVQVRRDGRVGDRPRGRSCRPAR